MWAGQDKEAEFYLHKSYEPLETAEIDEYSDQINLFGNECEGMCGVWLSSQSSANQRH